MRKRTKKVGITGRFGARYGSTLRKRVRQLLGKKYDKSNKCPKCQTPRIKRISVGIWICKKCGHKFAGGAWEPITPYGRQIHVTVSRLGQKL